MEVEEILSIYDEELKEIGTATRSKVHEEGFLHRVVHCWIVDLEAKEKWIYFQQRAFDKKDFPGLYDISAAGHVDAGEDFNIAVKREVIEEVGLNLIEEDLKLMGRVREKLKLGDFYDYESCEIYLYLVKDPEFKLGHEVEKMVKIALEDYKNFVLGLSENIKAFDLDSEENIIIRKEEFCLHTKEYMKSIVKFIEESIH